MSSSAKLLAIGLSLMALTAAAHSSGLHGEFVFDDLSVIVENPAMQRLPSAADLLQMRGLANASFQLNSLIGGLEPFGYHLVNIGIHATNVLLLWLLLRLLFAWEPSPWAELIRSNSETFAFWSALIWGVHPITTQAVAYTVQRYESLWSGFLLFGLLLYLHDLRRKLTDNVASLLTPALALAIVSFWVGMGCKEPIVLSLLALPVCDYVLGRWSGRQWLQQRLPLLGILFLPVLIAIPIHVVPSLTNDSIDTSAGFFATMVSPGEYWITQPEATFLYVSKILWPLDLCFDYLWPAQSEPIRLALEWLAFLVLIAATIFGVWHRRGWGLFAAFALLNLSTTYLIPLTDLVVEHRVYLASAWFISLLPHLVWLIISIWNLCQGLKIASDRATRSMELSESLAASRVGDETRFSKAAFQVAVSCMVVVLAVLTFNRSRVYESPLNLWKQTVEVAPWNYRARVNYADELRSADQYQEAVEQCLLALQLDSFKREPAFQRAKVYDALASAHSRAGNLDAAIVACQHSVDLTPGGSDHLLRMASIYAEHRKWTEAETALRLAISNRPKRSLLHEKLGQLLTHMKAWESAREAYRVAKELQPGDTEAIDVELALIGWMLGDQEASRKALDSIETPRDAQAAWARLAQWLTESGRWEEAKFAQSRSGISLAASHESLFRSQYRDLILAGNFVKARELINEGVRTANEAHEQLFWSVEAALLDYRQGAETEAETRLMELSKLHSTEGMIWGAMGDISRWKRESEDARKHYAKAIELGYEDSYLLNNLASILAESDPESAELHLRKSVGLDPTNFQAWHNLGNSLVRQGRVEESIPCYRRAIDINPGFEASRQTLERIIETSGAK